MYVFLSTTELFVILVFALDDYCVSPNDVDNGYSDSLTIIPVIGTTELVLTRVMNIHVGLRYHASLSRRKPLYFSSFCMRR